MPYFPTGIVTNAYKQLPPPGGRRFTGLATSLFCGNLVPHGFECGTSGSCSGLMATKQGWAYAVGAPGCVRTTPFQQCGGDTCPRGPGALEALSPSTSLHRAVTQGQQDTLIYSTTAVEIGGSNTNNSLAGQQNCKYDLTFQNAGMQRSSIAV